METLDLDLTKFENRPMTLFAIKMYKKEIQVEKESLAKLTLTPNIDRAIFIKRPSEYQFPDIDAIKLFSISSTGEIKKEWPIINVKNLKAEKWLDFPDGRSEFRITVKEFPLEKI